MKGVRVGITVKRIGKNEERLKIIDEKDGKLLLKSQASGFVRWYAKSSIISNFYYG